MAMMRDWGVLTFVFPFLFCVSTSMIPEHLAPIQEDTELAVKLHIHKTTESFFSGMLQRRRDLVRAVSTCSELKAWK